MQKNDLPYCAQLIKENDPDRFFLSMFVRAEHRDAVWALMAFNHEIAKTREVVSDSNLGHIRLQWWRDALKAVYEGQDFPAHEVVTPLAEAIQTYQLPPEHFEKLTYAREFDLENVLPGNLEGLMNYADFTSTPLMKLIVRVMGDDPEIELVQPIAVNYALAGILRAIPFHASQERCYLPDDLMVKHIVTQEKLFTGEQQNGLSGLLEEVANAQIKGIKPDNAFLKASNILADIYFKHLKSTDYDLFSPKYAMDPAFKAMRLTFRAKFM